MASATQWRILRLVQTEELDQMDSASDGDPDVKGGALMENLMYGETLIHKGAL